MTAADKQIDAPLPCPFCGGPVKLERARDTQDRIMGTRKWWGVVCRNTTNVGGTCCIEQVPSASERAAIERWNRRATTAPTVERTHENKPNPDLDKECSHKFEPFKPGLCICEICYQVRPAVKKEANASRYCQSCGNYVAVGMDTDHEDWCSELGWKKRALEAEELNRKFMESVNGPTHMGEPLLAAPAIEKEASIPCVHVNEPKACYRVRCQLGNKCVDDNMSPRAESENRSTGICLFCSHPIDGAHEEDCPQAAATAPDRHSILYEAGEALLAAEHHEAYEVLYRMMEECRAISLAAAPPAVEKEASIPPIFYNGETKRAPALKARIDAHMAMATRTASGPELQAALNASPAMGDSALEVLRTLIGFMADIELPDELRKSKELADAYATIRGTSYTHPPAQTADVRAMALEEACAAIKAEDDRQHDNDYMLDSDDCIRVIRALLEQKP